MRKRNMQPEGSASSQVPMGNGRKSLWTRADVFKTSSFPFGISRAEPQDAHVLHLHEQFDELSIVYSGEGVHFTENDEFPVRAGDVYVIKGEMRHGFKDVQDLYLVNVMYDPRHVLLRTNHVKKLPGYHVLFELEPRYRKAHGFESRLHLGPEELGHGMSLVRALEEELDRQEVGYEYSVTAILMQLTVFLCRCYSHAPQPSARSLLRMGDVISYIERNYSESIDLERLHELAGLSTSALLRNFKEATGLPPIEYLLRVRVSRAIELFQFQDMSITDIAFAVGFTDSNYFTRQFKQIMKVPPSEYRRRLQHTS